MGPHPTSSSPRPAARTSGSASTVGESPRAVAQDERESLRDVESAADGKGPKTQRPLEIVRHFHMSWFAIVMGWGGVALAINGWPLKGGTQNSDAKKTLYDIGTVIWVWDAVYCFVFICLLLARIVLYPREYFQMLAKPGESLFFGCVPMGLAVVAMGLVTFGPNIMASKRCHDGALALFWIDLFLCAISMSVPPWLMITRHSYSADKIPAAWLLPFVSVVVCSALAGTVGPHLETLHQQMYINIIGYVLWGMGISTASIIIAAYVNRLILHGLPPAKLATSVWVVLGPIGQGANAIMLLGRHTGVLQCAGYLCRVNGKLSKEFFDPETCGCTARQVPLDPVESWGYVAPGLSLLVGFVMWGFGLWVYWLGTTTVISYSRAGKAVIRAVLGGVDDDGSGIPFSVPWWGVVFPMVTLTMSTYQIHTDTNWHFFKLAGRALAAVLCVTAAYIHVQTFMHALRPSFWRGFMPAPAP